jgi:hypothetical protein
MAYPPDLDRILNAGLESDNRDMIAGLLIELRDYADDLRDVRQTLIEHLSACTDDNIFDTPYGRIQMGWKTARTNWDTDALVSKVITQKILDTRTGELESDLDAVRAVWNLGGPRTTVLKARNIDPDEYSERGASVRTATLPKKG